MPDIKLSPGETALWNEVGSRGDMYRAAMRDRAHEQTRVTGLMTEIQNPAGVMLDAIQRNDPVPETVYDPEPKREVASLPSLHKGEDKGDRDGTGPNDVTGPDDVTGTDSGRVIAGEMQPQAQKHDMREAAKEVSHHMHAVAKVVSGVVHDVAHKVGDRAKDLMHKAEEKLQH